MHKEKNIGERERHLQTSCHINKYIIHVHIPFSFTVWLTIHFRFWSSSLGKISIYLLLCTCIHCRTCASNQKHPLPIEVRTRQIVFALLLQSINKTTFSCCTWETTRRWHLSLTPFATHAYLVCVCPLPVEINMPVENLEEEGLPKNPNLELAQLKFHLETPKHKDDEAAKSTLLEAIKEDSKISWLCFVFLCACCQFWFVTVEARTRNGLIYSRLYSFLIFSSFFLKIRAKSGEKNDPNVDSSIPALA